MVGLTLSCFRDVSLILNLNQNYELRVPPPRYESDDCFGGCSYDHDRTAYTLGCGGLGEALSDIMAEARSPGS